MTRTPTTRRKAEQQPLPQTTEAAIAVLAEYATLSAAAARITAEAEAEIVKLRERRDTDLAPIEAGLKERFARLKPWWAVAGGALTGGARKSVELGGCIIGHRTTPPKLGLAGLGEEAARDALVLALQDHPEQVRAAVRIKTEINKPLVLGWVVDPSSVAGRILRAIGFAAQQKEEFFVDVLAPKPIGASTETAAPVEQVPA